MAKVSIPHADDAHIPPTSSQRPQYWNGRTINSNSKLLGVDDDGLRSESTVCLLTEATAAQQSEMSRLLETILNPKQDANYKTTRRQTARALSEINGQKIGPLAPSSYYAQNDTGRYSAPIYVLQDVSSIVGETCASHLDRSGACAMKRSTTRIKASPSYYDRTPASTQRQRSQTYRRPSQQQSASHCAKTNASSSNPSAGRNKSTECSVIPTNVAKAGDHQPARTTVGPSHTTSAMATRCANPAPPPPYTSHQLQRKNHAGKTSETERPSKTVRTYSVKKPLPYKADCATLRRRMSAAKNLAAAAASSRASLSSESLFTHSSDPHWRHADVDDDHDDVTADQLIPGTVNRTSSRPNLAALPRTPTPKPSLKELADGGRGHSEQQHATADVMPQHLLQEPYVNGQRSKTRSCTKGRGDDTQTDKVCGTVRSHSPVEHSVTSRYDNDYCTPEQHQQLGCNDSVDCPTYHVQIARKSADNVTGKQRQQQQQQAMEQYLQTSDLRSSASRESVATYRRHQRTTRTLRPPPPTLSMSTLATDAGRFATRPVPVAPSGPAGHRRASKIPRPKLGPRPMPSTSVMSTISRCSSVTSLQSEYNYARPMPIERIPFCKFGMECIVPLARQQVSITAVEAFSVTGVSGQRKRFLPLTGSIAEDFWKRAENAVAPLPVAKAQYDPGENSCDVSIISSLVARSVAHAATQTRKSVLLSTDSRARRSDRKKTGSSRKDNPEKLEDDNEDYAGLLVKLVHLIYLQTKLNASKGDRNNSAGNEVAHQTPVTHSTLFDQLHGTAQTNTRPYSSQQADRVYRTGSSVTQVYSKNHPGGHADDDVANSWTNDIKARTVYFDNTQSGTKKPWYGYRTPTAAAFKPDYSQRKHHDNRYDRISNDSGMRYGYGYRPTTTN